ncbi:MAG: cupin domain-containing protein [Pseudonocardiaceae bacterium]
MIRSGFVVTAGNGRPVPSAGGSLLASAAATGGAFSLLVSDVPAGDHVPLHVHDAVDEAFYILDGRYHIHCGEQEWFAAANDFVSLPRDVPHSYHVVSGPARSSSSLSLAGSRTFSTTSATVSTQRL